MYKSRDIFLNVETGDFYILSQVDDNTINLISLSNGNRWDKPVKVSSANNVTEEEFKAFPSYKLFRITDKQIVLVGD